jgi:serine-type D-Ala-D-Ala carboxypeptidase (penicillin-binding protein 5/6)
MYNHMRYWIGYFVSVVLLAMFFSIVFWAVTPERDREPGNVTSPLPGFLSMLSNSQVRFLDLWLPETGESQGEVLPVTITATGVLMYDLTTGKTIYELNATERMPMASLTKIMTAIVALENRKLDDRYVVRAEYLVGENTMGIQAGEVFTLKELLYGLILHSGNDAAETLAGNYPGGRDAFIQAMNQKALALGLTDTRFPNPSGLQGDGLQHSTAYDLLVMTRYALEQFPEFREIAATVEMRLPATATHQEYLLTNETNLLKTYPGVKGVKTGYTPEAGLCLVTYLDYKGHQIIGIILNSQNRRQEMKELLDFSLKKMGVTPPTVIL